MQKDDGNNKNVIHSIIRLPRCMKNNNKKAVHVITPRSGCPFFST